MKSRNSNVNRVRIKQALIVVTLVFLLLTLQTVLQSVSASAYSSARLDYIVRAASTLEQCIYQHVPLTCAATYRSLYDVLDGAPEEQVRLVHAIEERLDWEALKTYDSKVVREYVISKSMLQSSLDNLVNFDVTNDPDGKAYEKALDVQYAIARDEAYARR
jgi:hypothetical protein